MQENKHHNYSIHLHSLALNVQSTISSREIIINSSNIWFIHKENLETKKEHCDDTQQTTMEKGYVI